MSRKGRGHGFPEQRRASLKMPALAAVGILALLLVVACDAVLDKRNGLEREIQSINLGLGRNLSREITKVLNLGLTLEEMSDFRKLVDPLMATVPDLAYVIVCGEEGEVLFRAGNKVGGSRVGEELQGVGEERFAAIQKRISREGKEYFHTAVPLSLKATLLIGSYSF